MWTLLLALAIPASAQQAPAPAPAQQAAPAEVRTYVVILRGTPIGREELTVRTDADGTTLSAQARVGAPINLVTRKAEIRYLPDWTPRSLAIDGTLNDALVLLNTDFSGGTASSTGTQAGRQIVSANAYTGRTLVLPNTFFGSYEAVGRRLAAGGAPGEEFTAFIAPGVSVPVRVRAVVNDQMQNATAIFAVRRYELLFGDATGELLVNLATDERGGLVRMTVPEQGLDVVREDLTTATARTQFHSNPGDEPVTIPAAGFNLGATLTRPGGAGLPARLPAVVLLSGAGASDRDSYLAGVPVLGQVAGALSQAGFVVVRYDKRGFGQSGGRAESATLSDHADDARTVINWLSRRRDIDPKRIAIAGHSEGAWVALLAASRENRIAAVVALATPSATGAELVLEQQTLALAAANAPPAEREEKTALQKTIQNAVLTGRGWETVPPAMRRQADTPWFQSLLAYNPATVVDDVRQPLLFMHGELDRQVPVAHLERVAALARTARRSRPVEAVAVPRLNHLLVPAATGEVSEYGSLADRNVSRDVTTPIAAWLTKTFAAIR
jgi:dipeptidyl aminopeptidase/acylaminoacyl peptidase